MSHTLTQVLSLSILLSAIISVVRFRTTDSSYFPFILLLWIGAINELLSIMLMNFGYQTAINNNIYVLTEAVLILWLYTKLLAPERHPRTFVILLITYLLFWTVENFMIAKITRISSYFRIYYSFTIVLLSINLVNHFLFSENGVSLKSPSFLICLCFIIFFTYKILVEAFWIYGLNNSSDFRNNVYAVLIYLNLFVNLVFALVALWIPRKQKHLLLS